MIRCKQCHLGEPVKHERWIDVWVADGCEYEVLAVGKLCTHCQDFSLSKAETKRSQSFAYVQHKLVVLERDGWRCQRCGKGHFLEVHHIVRRSRAGKNKHSLANLTTLCVCCHKAEHGQ